MTILLPLLLAGQSLHCGDDAVCGIAEDDSAQIVGSMTSENVVWENWRSSPNNDCGETGGPVSLTVEADQSTMASRRLTLCLPRPDKLSSGAVDVNDAGLIRVIDIFADVEGGNCLASLDRSMPLTGTLAFPGICDKGLHPGGYGILFDLSAPMTITCGQDSRSEVMVFSESAAVTATAQP
jgi:hypothetical protein